MSAYGADYDTVEVEACTRAGVAVMNQAGSNAGAVAEHSLGLMLGLSKRIAGSDRRLRRGALFITTARGGIHDEAALEQALRSGHLGGAGLDVWSVEPPPVDHPLLTLDNVLATHHTAGVTVDSRRQMATTGASQILKVAHGARPPRQVNPEVWPAYASRFERVLRRPAAA